MPPRAQAVLRLAGLDCDDGSEFINHEAMHLAADRLIFFTATKKPIDSSHDATGKRKRIYDTPCTLYQPLKESGILLQPQAEEFGTLYGSINPVQLTWKVLAMAADIEALRSGAVVTWL